MTELRKDSSEGEEQRGTLQEIAGEEIVLAAVFSGVDLSTLSKVASDLGVDLLEVLDMI